MTSTLFPRTPYSRGNLLTSAPWTNPFIWATWGLLPTPNIGLLTLPRLSRLLSPVLVPGYTEWNPQNPNGPLLCLTCLREKTGLVDGLLIMTVMVAVNTIGDSIISVINDKTTLRA